MKRRRPPSPRTAAIAAAARRWQVCSRTIRRWERAGVAMNDPVQVGEHLLKIKNPAPAALAAVKTELLAELARNHP
jgi:hypothetical protein